MVIKQRYDEPVMGSSEHFTEPNQSYSVRQIIDQYSRGELMAKTFNPSDNINDMSYSDDELEHVIDFEDEFEAFDHLQSNQYKQRKEEHEQRKEEHESVETETRSDKKNTKAEAD